LNLRERPDANSKALDLLPQGTLLKFIEANNGGEYAYVNDTTYGQWLKVRTPTNKVGYVFGNYVSGAYELLYDGQWLDELPQLQWYGIYQRDSFADETRRVRLSLEKTENEVYGSYKTVKTNQKDKAKFIVGSVKPLATGFCGSLGMYDPGTQYVRNDLSPGALLSVYPGIEMGDTSYVKSWFLAATGCGELTDTAIVVNNYRLFGMDDYPQSTMRQELTEWFKMAPGNIPSVSIMWYGDLDGDRKPDLIIEDCPELGCRNSLFLTSKARPGELFRKVCEYYQPMD
jgi:Bacterial SH3 domain